MPGVILKQVSGCVNLTLGTGFDIWYLFYVIKRYTSTNLLGIPLNGVRWG